MAFNWSKDSPTTALLGLATLLLIVQILRAVWPLRTRTPSCAHCHYDLSGNETLTCPECGSDLRRVGLVTPATELQARPSITSALACWAMVAFALGWVFARPAVISYVSRAQNQAIQAVTAMVSTSQTRLAGPVRSPAAELLNAIDVSAESVKGGAGMPSSSRLIVDIERPDSSHATLAIEGNQADIKGFPHPELIQPGPPSEVTVKSWLLALGATDSAELDSLAKNIASRVTPQRSGGMTTFSFGSTFGGPFPGPRGGFPDHSGDYFMSSSHRSGTVPRPVGPVPDLMWWYWAATGAGAGLWCLVAAALVLLRRRLRRIAMPPASRPGV